MALLSYRNTQVSTPVKFKPPEPIEEKIRTVDKIGNIFKRANQFGLNSFARGRPAHTWNIRFLNLFFVLKKFLHHLHAQAERLKRRRVTARKGAF